MANNYKNQTYRVHVKQCIWACYCISPYTHI